MQSDWARVSSGVPQGGILGLFLFLVHVNDIPESLSCPTVMFADDTLLHHPSTPTSSSSVLQESLVQITDWCNLWLFRTNAQKYDCMQITRAKEDIPCSYIINDNLLDQVSTHNYKHLGVVISSNLSWKSHVLHTAAKANRILGLLKRTFGKCPKAINIGYKSLVRPILEYACPVWNPD